MASALAISPPPSFLKLLAHEIRWRLLETLAYSDRRVHELVALLGQPQNLVSYHLNRLRGQDLVKERRSSADRRDIYYSLDLDRLRNLFFATGEQIHPGLAVEKPAPRQAVGRTGGRPRVLFLCTHNSARSQMAEGLLRHLGEGRVEAASAGTEVTRVHPLAIQTMERKGIDISGQRSKHMDELAVETFDYVVTVCDRAGETCPVFPGEPERIHWSIPDPSAVQGSEEEKARAFESAATDLLTRIRYLLTLIERQAG